MPTRYVRFPQSEGSVHTYDWERSVTGVADR